MQPLLQLLASPLLFCLFPLLCLLLPLFLAQFCFRRVLRLSVAVPRASSLSRTSVAGAWASIYTRGRPEGAGSECCGAPICAGTCIPRPPCVPRFCHGASCCNTLSIRRGRCYRCPDKKKVGRITRLQRRLSWMDSEYIIHFDKLSVSDFENAGVKKEQVDVIITSLLYHYRSASGRRWFNQKRHLTVWIRGCI